jgi:hypothetical protein
MNWITGRLRTLALLLLAVTALASAGCIYVHGGDHHDDADHHEDHEEHHDDDRGGR